ncbi:MAG: 16S rRNA (cytosine(1402)-N(4))-methyltransferase RsmH [Spirochaetales bacterium]|nr:16S rRNA (cytosine(1402)-N(4))-methyltransferase RsmH [Spirochaetales bacterium]
MMYVHTPVLLDEVLMYLTPVNPRSLFVDATLGEGGYTFAFLNSFPHITLIGIDRDLSILGIAEKRCAGFGKRSQFLNMWFDEFFKNYSDYHDIYPDRIIFDLGISRFHYEVSGRGFSFAKEEPLDMRLSEELPYSAFDIVNNYPEDDLSALFRDFGEERFARRIARIIVAERAMAPIDNAFLLSEIIKRAVPRSKNYGSKIHPATRCFQALRIEVNSELKRLSGALDGAFNVLEKGGRLGVVSYHSLEDRIVKRFFKLKNSECTCPPEWPVCRCDRVRQGKILTKKPVIAGSEEVKSNHAARSAKLRVIEKVVQRSTL